MTPKGKVGLLVAVFAAIGLITATGAFTTVTAERTATVTTAGDSSALLALAPASGPNGANYAEETDGTLELHLDGSANSGSSATGVNLNALTQVDEVFTITTQGTQEVEVWISKNGDNAGLVTFYDGAHDESRTAIEAQGDAHDLDVGDSVTVSMDIDTRDSGLGTGDEILSGITVHANATSS